jgi:hypothetical protein
MSVYRTAKLFDLSGVHLKYKSTQICFIPWLLKDFMALKLKYVVVTAALFLAVSFCLEQRAYAYVDPGSSLMLFQSISAMITGTLFYFRKRLKSLFTRSSTSSSTDVSDK